VDISKSKEPYLKSNLKAKGQGYGSSSISLAYKIGGPEFKPQ
jgi:hypothetical protein